MSSRHVKKFNDSSVAGGFVRLCQSSVCIVDTPAFQRLRFLKQLGASDFVYPTATHTRFDHSLGVAHRAREMLLELSRGQPELGVTEEDLVVVEVAGLCHDLGHGPFSHAFETVLVPRILGRGGEWHHEEQSCVMFDYICQHYETRLSAEQQMRVKDLILSGRRQPQADWRGKEFMFDIVANKRNGLDVDKLDYLKRDNSALGGVTTSEFGSLLESMRVIGGEVCFKAARRGVVLEVYAARARMHDAVYSHPVCKAVELMIMDALTSAAGELGIAEALRDPERFALLDDTIVREVERSRSQSEGIKRAQQLLSKLRLRDIYKLCGQVDVPKEVVGTFEQVTAEDVVGCQQDPGGQVRLVPSDVFVHNLAIDFTKKQDNPLKHVGFYQNDSDEVSFTLEGDNPFEPGTFLTRQVRVYLVRLCEDADEKRQYMGAVQQAFGSWCNKRLPKQHMLSPNKSALTASSRKRPLSSPPQLPPLHLAPALLPGRAARAGDASSAAVLALEGLAAQSGGAVQGEGCREMGAVLAGADALGEGERGRGGPCEQLLGLEGEGPSNATVGQEASGAQVPAPAKRRLQLQSSPG